MARLTRLSTRRGDHGTTRLGGGQKVPKDSLRVEAYGTVDELNAFIGMALSQGLSDRLAEALPHVQNDLLHLGSDLSFVEEDKAKHSPPQIEARHMEKLEALLKELVEIVGPLDDFILPGGTPGAAQLQAARGVCRRAERRVIAVSRQEGVGPYAIPFLNRLSDTLFAMARYENKQHGISEPLWDQSA